MSLMAMEAAESRIVMTFARRNPEPQVLADRLQIVLVLVNLLRNSMEALRAQPQQHRGISIEIEEPTEKAVVFRVRDNGPGFAAGFDLNTHEVGQSEKPHGLGVGLGICRSIIDAHQGRLYVERRARGASVVFTLARAGDSRS
jgi:C4-dicarboxylate-specific signal transduction histidine kinase